MNRPIRAKVFDQQNRQTCILCMRLCPLPWAVLDIENCILSVVCTTVVSWFLPLTFVSFAKTHSLAVHAEYSRHFFRHKFGTTVGWGVCVCVDVGDFDSMWSIHQVIRSLENFHWKVYLGPFCVAVVARARICYTVTVVGWHSFAEISIRFIHYDWSLYAYTVFMPSARLVVSFILRFCNHHEPINWLFYCYCLVMNVRNDGRNASFQIDKTLIMHYSFDSLWELLLLYRELHSF